MQEDKNQSGKQSNTDPENAPEKKQEQSDPQLTELKGFVDPSEDLEPTLTDGTKAPEKEAEKYKENKKEDQSV